MKSRGKEEDASLISSKRRKLYSQLENEYSGDVENTASSSASRTSGCSKHEEYSSNGVERSLRSPDLLDVDLESEGFETENSTSIDRIFSREATPTSELCGDSEEGAMMDSSPMLKKKSPLPPARPRRRIPAEKMPSEAELEEFFAAAEDCEAKRFAEKYNYDIVKDVPLEGRYQWVRLLP